jgi:hypothetical protein
MALNKAGIAWQKIIEGQELPAYTFTLSVATVNQSEVDETGNLNFLIKRLPEKDKNTKATHAVYFVNTKSQSFDEYSEMLISVNRKKLKSCFFMNGFYTLHADASEKKIYKKLNAYTYTLKEDDTLLEDKSKAQKQLGYAYLKLQLLFENDEQQVGKMYRYMEQGQEFFNLYIDKVKVLDLADVVKENFYVVAQLKGKSEFVLFFSPEINYKSVDFVFNFSRRAFMHLGMSDNNGNIVFVAYPQEVGIADGSNFEIFYAHYHPDNAIREKSFFAEASGWKAENMTWIN